MATLNEENFALCVLMSAKLNSDQVIHELGRRLEKHARTKGYDGDIVVDRVSLEVPASTLMIDEPGMCIVLYVEPAQGVGALEMLDGNIRAFPAEQVFMSTKASVNHAKGTIETIERLTKHCHMAIDNNMISGHLFQLEYFNRLLADRLLGKQPGLPTSHIVDDVSEASSDISACDDSGIASPPPPKAPARNRRRQKDDRVSGPSVPADNQSTCTVVNTQSGASSVYSNNVVSVDQDTKPLANSAYAQDKINHSTRPTDRARSVTDKSRALSVNLAEQQHIGASTRNTHDKDKTDTGKDIAAVSRTSGKNRLLDALYSEKTKKPQDTSSTHSSSGAAFDGPTAPPPSQSEPPEQQLTFDQMLIEAEKVPLPRWFSIGGDRRLLIGEADITKMNVDCIVSASNKFLKINVGVSRAIADAAGRKMYDFCKRYVQKNGSLGETKCVLSHGFNLPSQWVLHAVGPDWRNYKGRENECYRLLSLTITNILMTAETDRLHSIAIPAISSGNFGGSPNEVACSIVDTILNTASSLKTLKDIHLVDIKKDMLHRYCTRMKMVEPINSNITEITGGSTLAASRPRTQKPVTTHADNQTILPQNRDNRSRSSADDSSIRKLPTPPTTGDITQLTSTFHSMDMSKKQNTTQAIGVIPLQTYEIFGNKIIIENGNIVELKVECMVSASNKRLEFKGGVAKVIAKAAGPKLYQFRDKYMATNKYLKETECVVSPGFDLHCKYILHSVGPTKDDHQEKATCFDALCQTIKRCLATTEKQGCSSIAIPAISSGNSGVPPKIVSEAMAQTVWEFMEKSTIVKEVHLIDMNSDILGHIMDSLEQRQDIAQRRGRERSTGGSRRRRSSSFGNVSDLQRRKRLDADDTDAQPRPVLTRPHSSKTPVPATGASSGPKHENKATAVVKSKINSLVKTVTTSVRPKTSPSSTGSRLNPLRASHDLGGSPQAAKDDTRGRASAKKQDYKPRQRSNSMSGINKNSFKRLK